MGYRFLAKTTLSKYKSLLEVRIAPNINPDKVKPGMMNTVVKMRKKRFHLVFL